MNEHAPVFTRRCPCAYSFAVVLIASSMTGCQPTPRADLDAERNITQAVGLDTPIKFVVLGPDGGPLDEPDAAGATLTLNEAVRRAVTTAPAIQSALARVRIALADADQLRLLPNPLLNLTLRWGPGEPQIEASLAQDLIQVLQLPRRASAADNRLYATASDAVTTALDVATEAQEHYIAAQASSALVPVLQERLAILDRLTAIAQAKLQSGEGTRSDVVTLEAQRIELLVDMEQAGLTAREHRLRLARIIGEPSSAADWTLDPWASPATGLAIESSWIDAGLKHRPEIQSIIWKLAALGDDEALLAFAPWQGSTVGPDVQRDSDWTIGPSISTPIPLFDTGSAQRSRVSAQQLEARHELTLARRKVVEDVRVAYQTMTASAANLARIRKELIPLQEQRRTLAEAAYRAGQSDVTPLFLAEQDLRLTQAKAIEIELQAATAYVRLQRAVGGAGITPASTPSTQH